MLHTLDSATTSWENLGTDKNEKLYEAESPEYYIYVGIKIDWKITMT